MSHFLILVNAIMGVILTASPVQADWWGYGPGCLAGWGRHGFFGPVFMIFFWILIILGIIWFFKSRAHSGKDKTEESAIDIIKKRYAKGEITREDFEKMKDDLTKT